MPLPQLIAFASAGLQLAAAALALRLVRATGKRVAWGLLSAALLLMTARRLPVPWGESTSTGYELLGLVISTLLLSAVRGVARLFAEGERARRTTAALGEIAQHIAALDPPTAVFALVCEKTVELLGVPLAWIAFEEKGTLRIGAAAGELAAAAAEIHAHTPERSDACPAEEALRSGRLRLRRDLGTPEAPPWAHRARAAGLDAAAAVPLTAGGATVGVLCVYARRGEDLDAPALALAEAFARGVGIAVQQARHLDQLAVRHAVIEAAANAVMITDRDGAIEWVNPAFTRLTGFPLEEAAGKTPRLLASGLHDRAFYAALWDTILDGRVWQGELTNRRRDGSLYTEEQTITPLRGADGQVVRFVAIKQDISARKVAEAQVRHLALHDPLTDLPNRRALEDELRRTVERSRRGQRGVLLLVDLDSFKLVNDTLGHAVGDRVLVETAGILRSAIRPGDTLARLGGDEFVVLLHDAEPEEAHTVAERLRRAVDGHRFSSAGERIEITTSVGLVPLEGDVDATGVLALADLALYAAKDGGRNRVEEVRAGASSPARLLESGHWITRIREALRGDGFLLEFQPVVRLATGETAEHEALVRLRDGAGPPLLPATFLPVAERFGLAPSVDAWVVEHALVELERRPGLRLWVNLSGPTLGSPDRMEEIEARLRVRPPGAGRLSFEITETAAVADVGAALRWMERLRAHGCRFALDDFGTGFSSFRSLQALPADFVKIDATFVRGVESDPANRALVSAVVEVARALGKETVGEGVETPEAAAALLALGVDYGQGWHFGRPGPLL